MPISTSGKARESLARVGWDAAQYGAKSLADAHANGATFVTDDAAAILNFDGIDCIIEATGHPIAGTRHALGAIEAGKHIVMVNVEADVMCGPILAAKARAKNLVYSMAYGDQPAFICELVDWVRSVGFELVSAGKGMNFEPRYRYSTPDTVWGFFGWTEEEVAAGDFNPKMYNSFTDGTKAAIEMAAVANGTEARLPRRRPRLLSRRVAGPRQRVQAGLRGRGGCRAAGSSRSPRARSPTGARC